ncbi:hypothetical protein APHAL10511_001212 [Amanita phalloides]|nr:hypothetical protein APHAL10511_001212 [Amanita phalloides]
MDSFPRSLLPCASHSTIDAILKDLKICHRRIHHALDYHADELRLLRRLYYKSKNQHRGAHFWRHFVEIRRYSERLDNTSLSSTLEDIRISFFGPEAKQNQNLLKRSWTHLPPKESVIKVINHYQAQRILLQKIQERSLVAYRSFTLAMQRGAFVQLLVVFAGMISRIRALSIEVDDAMQVVLASLSRYVALDVPKAPLDSALQASLIQEVTKHETSMCSLNEPTTSLVQAIPRIAIRRKSDGTCKIDKTSGRTMQSGARKDDKVQIRKRLDEIDDIFSVMQ